MKANSLTARLLVATTLALMATMACIALLTYLLMTHFPRLLLEADFRSNATHVSDGLVYDATGRPVALDLPTGLGSAFAALKQDVLYRVLDVQGQVLLPAEPQAQALTLPGMGFDPTLTRFDMTQDGQLLHVATFPLTRPEGHYFVQIARSERFQQALTHNDGDNAREVALATTFFTLAVFIIIVFYTVNRVLKPLHAASQAAASIAPGNLHTRLSTQGMPSELLPMINALNAALERLAVGYHVQQEFLATVAHELKTPLALMRGTIELGTSPDRDTLMADIDGMSRQVQQLLQLAECSEAHNYTMAATDAAAVARDAIDKLERLAQSRGVTFEAPQLLSACPIRADRGALFILLRNLLENAIQHAPWGSRVEVALTARGLSVHDHGPGIPARDLPMLFRRYWRGQASDGGGTGLGLAICLQIAGAHAWTLSAHNAEPGARFQVEFYPPTPAAPAAPAPRLPPASA